MYVMIDNFDSFVYNLKAYFEELGREILVKRCDEITLEELEELEPEGIILSPGLDAARVKPNRFQGSDFRSWEFVWISGVGTPRRCGGEKENVPCARCAATEIRGWNPGVAFTGRFKVTRYHSLIVRGESLPEEYQVDAVSKDRQ